MKYSGMTFARALMLILLSVVGIGSLLLVAARSSDNLPEAFPSPFPSQEIGKQVIRGEVVMIEGELQVEEDPSTKTRDGYLIMDQLYVAKDIGEEPIHFHLNERTQMDDDVRVGDKVEVLASGNGVALSIKKTE